MRTRKCVKLILIPMYKSASFPSHQRTSRKQGGEYNRGRIMGTVGWTEQEALVCILINTLIYTRGTRSLSASSSSSLSSSELDSSPGKEKRLLGRLRRLDLLT